MIQATHLAKRYGRLDVLRDLTLETQSGRITAIVGPNGSGKSTLIRIIVGLVRADSGTVSVAGRPVGRDPSYRAAIGYMPQVPRFPENLTGREVLGMVADLRGNPPECDRELISLLSLDDQLDRRLGTLSTGMRQKINAVLAFLFRPDLLILDEPTAGLDPVAAAILKDKLMRERDAGRTVVLTTHIMSEVQELADEVAFLLDGRLRFVRPPADVLRDTGEPTLERGIARLMRQEAAA